MFMTKNIFLLSFRPIRFSFSDNSFAVLYVIYDSLLVQHQYERLIYDASQLLSALGGSVGLTLGLSLFSVASGFLEIIENYVLRSIT